MTSKLLSIIALLLVLSCSSKKQIEKALYAGNYNEAIQDALKKIESTKDDDRREYFVVMLQSAYEKANERDLKTIKHLKKDGNPEHYKNIYELYLNLEARQQAIKPALPLQIKGNTIALNFPDYTDDIVKFRYQVSDYMHIQGVDLLDSQFKNDAKKAYSTFQYIERINPNYKDVRQRMQEAHHKGTEYIIVTIENQTRQVIPRQLEDDLLNFNTYGLNQFWTVYHANPDQNITYDYAMALQLKQINISPDQFHEKEILREKDIKDGWTYSLDRAGNVKKDSLGKDIKIDKIVKVKALYLYYKQLKSTQVLADLVYVDLQSNQTLDVFPIQSEFVYDNQYAIYKGDKRALLQSDLDLLKNQRLPFPAAADMIYDTGEDLKLKLKQIINSYKLQN